MPVRRRQLKTRIVGLTETQVDFFLDHEPAPDASRWELFSLRYSDTATLKLWREPTNRRLGVNIERPTMIPESAIVGLPSFYALELVQNYGTRTRRDFAIISQIIRDTATSRPKQRPHLGLTISGFCAPVDVYSGATRTDDGSEGRLIFSRDCAFEWDLVRLLVAHDEVARLAKVAVPAQRSRSRCFLDEVMLFSGVHTDYMMEHELRCPFCGGKITEETLVDWE